MNDVDIVTSFGVWFLAGYGLISLIRDAIVWALKKSKGEEKTNEAWKKLERRVKDDS